jgi:multicomponent Na+:H+ antiporter subunit G
VTLAVDVLSWILLVTGGAFSIIGGIGLIRMPDVFTRMHAASLVDTLGAGLILLGLLLQAGFTLVGVKLLFLGLFIFFASPAATHALVKAAFARGVQPQLAEGNAEGDAPSKR